MINNTPAYNLKVVLKETGLAADTLRAWERRYGLPTPGRSAGGHRLYSQRDIEIIKWLMARQAEGLSISRAVDLWNEQISSGNDLLADFVTPGLNYSKSDALESYRREWISACMAFNEYLAEKTLNQVFGIFPLETVCIEVLQRGLSDRLLPRSALFDDEPESDKIEKLLVLPHRLLEEQLEAGLGVLE